MRGCLATLPSNTTAGKPGRALCYKSIRNGNLYGKIPQSVPITNNNAFLIDIFELEALYIHPLLHFALLFFTSPFQVPKLYSSKATPTALGATPKRTKQPIHLHLHINDGLLLFAKAPQEHSWAFSPFTWGALAEPCRELELGCCASLSSHSHGWELLLISWSTAQLRDVGLHQQITSLCCSL